LAVVLATDILGEGDKRYEFKAVCLSTIGGLWIVYGVTVDNLYFVVRCCEGKKQLGKDTGGGGKVGNKFLGDGRRQAHAHTCRGVYF
jgi:hypothetical protein